MRLKADTRRHTRLVMSKLFVGNLPRGFNNGDMVMVVMGLPSFVPLDLWEVHVMQKGSFSGQCSAIVVLRTAEAARHVITCLHGKTLPGMLLGFNAEDLRLMFLKFPDMPLCTLVVRFAADQTLRRRAEDGRGRETRRGSPIRSRQMPPPPGTRPRQLPAPPGAEAPAPPPAHAPEARGMKKDQKYA